MKSLTSSLHPLTKHPALAAAVLFLIFHAFTASSCAPQSGGTAGSSSSRFGRHPIDFQEDIRPLLETRCLECHNSRINHGGLIMETRALTFRPRAGGPPIVPGNPDASPLYTVIRLPEDLDNAMPPTQHRLTREDIRMLHDWIKEGADWPYGEDGNLYPPAEKYPYPPMSHPAVRG